MEERNGKEKEAKKWKGVLMFRRDWSEDSFKLFYFSFLVRLFNAFNTAHFFITAEILCNDACISDNLFFCLLFLCVTHFTHFFDFLPFYSHKKSDCLQFICNSAIMNLFYGPHIPSSACCFFPLLQSLL